MEDLQWFTPLRFLAPERILRSSASLIQAMPRCFRSVDGKPQSGACLTPKDWSRAIAGRRGAAEDGAMPGFVDNPYAFTARASVFVPSSTYEGLPGVLIQALACGTPVVSTDWRAARGRSSTMAASEALVPVGDDAALAEAIEQVLDDPPPSEHLRARAELFSVDRAVDRYLKSLFPDRDEVQRPLPAEELKRMAPMPLPTASRTEPTGEKRVARPLTGER